MFDLNFFINKKVLITGHTGFKGSWLCKILEKYNSDVLGYSLPLSDSNYLFKMLTFKSNIKTIYGDIRDLNKLRKVFYDFQPEIVIHMAAQPLVRESYIDPVYTYEVNVMGTVNVLECIRQTDSVISFLNVTTDKVYKNREWEWGYRENEELNGFDPYSNSKSCSELVTSAYINSFFGKSRKIAVSTARAGNVIGGGDFAIDRIIPDCIRAANNGETIKIRNPESIRPYQHVLEPLMAYLRIVSMQFLDLSKAGIYNIGPYETSCVKTSELVDLFCVEWKRKFKKEIAWEPIITDGPYEASYLKLDISRIRNELDWYPTLSIKQAIELIVEWEYDYAKNVSVDKSMEKQISDYFENSRKIFLKINE